VFFVCFLLVFLLVLFSASALTKQTVIFQGDSYNFSDKNVTLIDIGEDIIIVCVNNQKGIVSDDEYFNGVEFDIKDIKTDYIDVILKTDCSDCVCDEDCMNDKCFVYDNTVDISNNDMGNNIDNGNIDNNGLIDDQEGNINGTVESGCFNEDECNDSDDNTVDNCINHKCYNILVEKVNKNKINPLLFFSLFLFILFVFILSLLLLKKR